MRHKQYASKTGYILRIGNIVMHDDLLRLGLQHRKSKIMRLPDIPDIYFPYFLRGYFDGDGCINTYLGKLRTTPSLTLLFTSGSRDFLSQLSSRLERLLQVPALGIYKSMGACNLACKGWRAVKILDYMYQNLQLAPYLTRKYLKYREFVDHQMGSRVRAMLVKS
jgi:hypothetical protein